MQRLTIDRGDGKELAVVERSNDGALTLVRASVLMRPDMERIIKIGLQEQVETGTSGQSDYDIRTKRIRPNDPQFLEALVRFAQNYGFKAVIEEV